MKNKYELKIVKLGVKLVFATRCREESGHIYGESMLED
jgi:hypothetical protein